MSWYQDHIQVQEINVKSTQQLDAIFSDYFTSCDKHIYDHEGHSELKRIRQSDFITIKLAYSR